jgi:hypothetical protein
MISSRFCRRGLEANMLPIFAVLEICAMTNLQIEVVNILDFRFIDR